MLILRELITNREIKNTAFADDATFMLDGSQKNFFNVNKSIK